MSESTEQQATIYWFRAQYPDKIIYANANGSWFGGIRGKKAIAYGAKRKREGLLAGVSDLFIPEPIIKHHYIEDGDTADVVTVIKHGLYIEMKAGGNTESSLTPDQKWFIGEMRRRGYEAHWAAGFEMAQAIIKNYFGDMA